MPQKGDIVRILAYVDAEYDNKYFNIPTEQIIHNPLSHRSPQGRSNNKVLTRHPVARIESGHWLVLGKTYIATGTRTGGNYGWNSEDYEPAYLHEDKRHPVWRITAYDPTGKDQRYSIPYTVLEDDMEIITPKLEDHFKTGRDTRPADVQPGDCFGYKVVATRHEHGPGYGASSWVAYRGPTEWTDQKVLDQGEKIGPKTARALFSVFANASEIHYEW